MDSSSIQNKITLLETMLEAVTGETLAIEHGIAKETYDTGKTKASVDVHVFQVQPTSSAVELLTREEGAALSALMYVFSVCLQREGIHGRVEFGLVEG